MKLFRNKKKFRKVLFTTLCLTLLVAMSTIFCFAADTNPDGTGIMEEIVSILTSGIASFGSGLASGINGYMQALFISSAGGLSTTGTIVVIFAAISLTCGITALVWNFISTLGARK